MAEPRAAAPPLAPAAAAGRLEALLATRSVANREHFAAHAERLAACCRRLAERFAAGGRLLALATAAAARSDARHVAVEFVHPVIVGKRALPALALTAEPAELARRAALLAEPGDAVIGFDPGAAEALAAARRRGCLTIGLGCPGAEWDFTAEQADPLIAQELGETLYHVLWELVHVFFEHGGLLGGGEAEAPADPGASAFLYPFLAAAEQGEAGLAAVLDDVRRSVLAKSAEIGELRERTLREGAAALGAAAAELRRRLDAGGRLLALGNGGSATDAADLVADFAEPPHGWPARPALDLAEDPAVLTAIANDVGVEQVFARQLIAHGREADFLVAITTSGGSANVLAALAEARRRGVASLALAGYDGGEIAAGGLADHVVVAPSQSIPRIQEAQASALHALRELVEAAP